MSETAPMRKKIWCSVDAISHLTVDTKPGVNAVWITRRYANSDYPATPLVYIERQEIVELLPILERFAAHGDLDVDATPDTTSSAPSRTPPDCGDVVRLTSGGTPMTVMWVDHCNGEIGVAWSDARGFHTQDLLVSCVRVVPDFEEGPF